jgi:hypothetical protein
MRSIGPYLFAGLVSLLIGHAVVFSQPAPPSTGTLTVNSRVKIGAKTVQLRRKRFYLFRGGFDANSKLIERLKTANVVSRDCFYCQIHASTEFMTWLKDCETAYCREITAEDIERVPEFKAAYEKGKASSTFSKKPELAQKWLITNLEKPFQSGFYDERQKELKELLTGIDPPVESSITNAAGTSAAFLNVPLYSATATEKFLLSNLIPIEAEGKSFVWACEIDLGTAKKTQALETAETSQRVKKCEVIVRDLPACKEGNCAAK